MKVAKNTPLVDAEKLSEHGANTSFRETCWVLESSAWGGKRPPCYNRSFEGRRSPFESQFCTQFSHPDWPAAPPPLSLFLHNPWRQCWQQQYDGGEACWSRGGKWSANGTLSPKGHLLTLYYPAEHLVAAYMCVFVWVCVGTCLFVQAALSSL